MTKDEALELALEALENLMNQHYAEQTTSNDLEKAERAITAIKEALAQPERDYERGFIDGMQKQMQSSVDKAVNRLAQPEQEYGVVAGVGKGVEIPAGVKYYYIEPKLPPQRKPLTDEQIAEMWLEILGSTPPSGIHEDGLQPWRFARAIEAAHGIKE